MLSALCSFSSGAEDFMQDLGLSLGLTVSERAASPPRRKRSKSVFEVSENREENSEAKRPFHAVTATLSLAYGI
jgi:hypothetical protein